MGRNGVYRDGGDVKLHRIGESLHAHLVFHRLGVGQAHWRHLHITRVESHQRQLLLNDDVAVGVGSPLQIAALQYVNLL